MNNCGGLITDFSGPGFQATLFTATVLKLDVAADAILGVGSSGLRDPASGSHV